MMAKGLHFAYQKISALYFIPLSMLVVFSTSCAYLPKVNNVITADQELALATNLRRIEELELNNAERAFADNRFSDASLMFRAFQNAHPHSTFFHAARVGEAQSIENLGNVAEAGQIYREVYLLTIKEQPNIAALALYRLSFVYEFLGDEVRTLATLLEAQKMAKFLPAEIAKAGIPARLASAYLKFNKQQEALVYLNQAEKGLDQLRSEQRKLDLFWLGNIYFQMGKSSTNQLSVDNFQQVINIQKMVQVYLLKAIKLNEPKWSQLSLVQAKLVYQDLFSTFALPISDRTQKNNMGGSLLDLIEQAELFKPFYQAESNNYEKEFFKFIKTMKSEIEASLYQPKETNFLTEESERLHSIKRLGRRSLDEKANIGEPEQISDKPSIKQPIKIVPTEDPNL